MFIKKQKDLVDEMLRAGAFCPKCGQWRVTHQERRFIEATGRCISCDHVEGDFNYEKI